MRRLAFALSALAIAAALSPTDAAAQWASEQTCYRNANGLRQCDSRTETNDSISRSSCVFQGGNYSCSSAGPESKGPPPEPTVEHVRIGGKTINVIRGMPQ